jgi:hypothetical protein
MNPLSDKAFRIKALEIDIQGFAEYYLYKNFNFPTPQFHKDWIKIFRTYQRIGIACARGHSKSLWFSTVFPLWSIVYQKKKFIVLLSDTQQQANEFLGQIIQEFETNDALKEDFGELAGYVPPSAKDKKKWTTSNHYRNKDYS